VSEVTDRSTASAERAISFGPFRLLPEERLLLEDGVPVRLGSRALAILTALVERAGELVSKNELMARVWPNLVVDECNLKVNVSALRRALGDGQPGRRYVANVSGRGYCFVAPVGQCGAGEPAAHKSTTDECAHNLPISQTRAVGRADTISKLRDQLPRQRLVTIVGAGGIGKTTVALTLAEALVSTYEDGVRFVDLALLKDPHLVPCTLASALGLTVHPGNAVPRLIEFLLGRRMLIVLDSCEHVIATAAILAGQLLAGTRGIHILATSREPLRVDGEHVHRLGPLEVPPSSLGLTAGEALTFSAVQLFVERVAANVDGFQLNDADAPIVADICRKLGGAALAIELAATRVDAFGIRQLSTLLDDRFRILNQGRRTAQPRHQSLTAALDWCYDYLPEDERVVLRRLSIFAGAFTLQSAIAVAGETKINIVEAVANLVAKSLVSADVGGAVVQYRLLGTMRAYALQKLTESGKLDEFARRHAEHHLDLFMQAEAEFGSRPAADWLEDYGRRVDDVRTALNWAFSPNGDASVGVALTVASIPLWTSLLLMNECHEFVKRTLTCQAAQPTRTERDEMKLLGALAITQTAMEGPPPRTEIL
jgi:predicted ATPase/DNA-binding winged helix-turn-helix (wHTH) protein